MLNWFSAKPKSGINEPSPLQIQRCKQIEQLKAFNHNVSEIQRDLEYRVNIYGNGGTVYSLFISLSPKFPADKPVIKVSPRIQHPWVDDLMFVTGSQSINNFSVHSDLGKAVKEIVDEFTRNPPILLQQQQTFPQSQSYVPTSLYSHSSHSRTAGKSKQFPGIPYPGYSSCVAPIPTLQASGYTKNTHVSTTLSRYQPHVVDHGQIETSSGAYKMPNVPSNFPHLFADKSVDELQTILNNEDKLEEIVSQLIEVKKIYQDMESMAKNNELLAKENLEKKPLLEDKKRTILEKYDMLNELHDTFNNGNKKQKELMSSYNKQAIQDRLQIAASQAEEDAESTAENFLEGEIKLEEFKKKFMDLKTLSYLRKAKEEKLQTVIFQPQTT